MASLSRLKGFALMESIFAMVVIMICFGITMMIFNMITSGSAGTCRINARIRLQAEATMCKEQSAFSDEVIAGEEFAIEKTFLPYKDNPAITEMRFLARNAEGKIIAEYHELLVR